MNAFPAERSVLVLDNCRIHHNDVLVDLVKAAGGFLILYCSQYLYLIAGCILLYLPAYSPDLNPIEELFSTCKLGS